MCSCESGLFWNLLVDWVRVLEGDRNRAVCLNEPLARCIRISRFASNLIVLFGPQAMLY